MKPTQDQAATTVCTRSSTRPGSTNPAWMPCQWTQSIQWTQWTQWIQAVLSFPARLGMETERVMSSPFRRKNNQRSRFQWSHYLPPCLGVNVAQA